MPLTLRTEPTRCAVQVFPRPVGIPIRFKDAAMSSSDHRVAILRITARASSGGAAAMLARPRLADPQLRLLATASMDCQDDLARRLVDIGDDVDDQGAQKPLARAHGHAWRVPCGVEIVRQTGEVWQRDGR